MTNPAGPESLVRCPCCDTAFILTGRAAGSLVECTCSSLWRVPDPRQAQADQAAARRLLQQPIRVRRPGAKSRECPGLVVLADWIAAGRVRPADLIQGKDDPAPLPAGLHALTGDLFPGSGQPGRRRRLTPLDRLLLSALGLAAGELIFDGSTHLMVGQGHELVCQGMAGAVRPESLAANRLMTHFQEPLEALRRQLRLEPSTAGEPEPDQPPKLELPAVVDGPEEPPLSPESSIQTESAGVGIRLDEAEPMLVELKAAPEPAWLPSPGLAEAAPAAPGAVHLVPATEVKAGAPEAVSGEPSPPETPAPVDRSAAESAPSTAAAEVPPVPLDFSDLADFMPEPASSGPAGPPRPGPAAGTEPVLTLEEHDLFDEDIGEAAPKAKPKADSDRHKTPPRPKRP